MARVAILGWGSLYWDAEPKFDRWHRGWHHGDGPIVKIEYSQIVAEKDDGVSLVIDPEAGAPCRVGHAFSKRFSLDAVVRDLTRREETSEDNIGRLVVADGAAHGHDIDTLHAILDWAIPRGVDAVVWTDTRSNFEHRCGRPFTIGAAIEHIRSLDPATKAKVAEYVWRSPPFVRTPLRTALQRAPWF